jgi:hypothetical protein
MKWPWRRARDDSDLSFTPAAQPPWRAAGAFGVLAAFAMLEVSGIDVPSVVSPLFLPLGLVIPVTWIISRLSGERSISIFEWDGHRFLSCERGGRVDRICLDELSSVSREREGDPPALTLIDLREAVATVPLGAWTDEKRLLTEVSEAAARSGASGGVGSSVPVSKPGWIRPAWVGLMLGTFAAIIVVVNANTSTTADIEPVTKEQVAATAGVTRSPFAQTRSCDLFVVPVDRPSEARAADLARALERQIHVQTCPTSSFSLDVGVVDDARQQADAPAVLEQVSQSYRAVWGTRPATVLGVTELDLFSSWRRDWRFVFGSRFFLDRTQGHGVISTARMGSGDDRDRRLETMGMRYVGFLHFGLPESPDPTSALYPTILSLGDLDRMRPQFADPPPSEADLRAARERFLRG